MPPSTRFDQPRRELAAAQADWLRGARSRLLRRADIARRESVLDLGAGWGLVTRELRRRCRGRVVALDRHPPPAAELARDEGVTYLAARAEQLPFEDAVFDLVFAQLTFLWLDAATAVAEAARVLRPGGAVVAIEPDFGTLVEHPPEIATREIWLAALARAGADPLVGRKLPGLFAAAGLTVETRFLDRLEVADAARFDLLAELPLTPDQQQQLAAARAAWQRAGDQAVVHLPFWLVLGEK